MSFQGHQICGHIVNVFVGVLAEEFPVSFKGIVNLNLRHVPYPPHAARHAVGGRRHDTEIVDAIETPFELLSRGGCNSDGHSSLASRAAATSASTTRTPPPPSAPPPEPVPPTQRTS